MSASSTGNVVRIVEVGPRDGLQNIAATIPLSTKLELINQLHRTGLQTIELTSVVSSRSIPQLADCQVLLSDPGIQKLLHDNRFRLPVLIPNLKGLRIAIQKNVREVAVFVSASEGFSTANINCSVLQGLERAREVARSAQSHGIAVRG
jgi:hydroxymethylglutaryl-CoA lyase